MKISLHRCAPTERRILEAKGDSRATREKDHGAAERVLRRGLRRSHNCARFGSASPGASYLQIAAVALADMAQLCGELSVYRPRLDQSPPSHALCGRLWLSLLHREIAHVLRQRLTRKIGVQHPDLVAQVILQRVRCLAVFKIRPLQGKVFSAFKWTSSFDWP